MTSLSAALAAGWTQADPDDPEPTVRYFQALLDQHPADAEALLGYAGALDFAGREAEAAPVYRRALAAGLDGEDLRRCLIQYGSTLRNLQRYDQALAALDRADELFPGQAAVQVFRALTLTSAGRSPEAVAALVGLALDRIAEKDLGHYERALRNYAAQLTD